MNASIICVSYPTIMSGLVLRWYADDSQDVQIANAGREGFTILDESCPAKVRIDAEAAHELIRQAYNRNTLSPTIDVSRWVTHRRVGSILSRDLEPVVQP